MGNTTKEGRPEGQPADTDTRPTVANCGNCKAWRTEPVGENVPPIKAGWGECHLGHPKLVKPGSQEAMWPLTPRLERCEEGQWQ